MVELNTIEDVSEYLLQQKIVKDKSTIQVTKLSGGVSSRVWKIVSKGDRWILKQALAKLDVKADWFSDVERIHREHEVMQMLSTILPADAIPEVLHTDYVNHVFMMTCIEEEPANWKDILMGEIFNDVHASQAGNILRLIHINSDKIDRDQKQKLDQKYFIQLRVEPFHRYLIERYPALSLPIGQLIQEVTEKKICLTHGDFSPKNMLIKKNDQLVLIDFEVAHWGNPVFDVAYCLGHLMLKGWHLKKPRESERLIQVFLSVYDHQVDNLIAHLGLMLLARMDGKSPVNYITDENLKNAIRKVAKKWITGDAESADIMQCIRLAYANTA